MRLCKTLVAVAGLFALTGCISSTTEITVKPDGSGTIQTVTMMGKAALEQFKAMAASFGDKGGAGKTADLFSEKQLREAAAKMGEGVAYVSSQPVKSADMEGVKALYTFKDVTKLRVSQKPDSPAMGMGTSAAPPKAAQADDVAFRFARQPNGHSLLTLVFPERKMEAEQRQKAASPSKPMDPQQLAMVKTMFKGMKIDLAVVVDGRIVKTNSPYVAGNRVTIVEMDFEQLLADESKLSQIQSVATIEEAKRAFKDVKGFKMNLDPEVQIEFAGK